MPWRSEKREVGRGVASRVDEMARRRATTIGGSSMSMYDGHTTTNPPQIEERAHRVIPEGVYTVQGPKGHKTFSVERQPEKSDWAPGKRVVYLLTGSGDSHGDWKAFAFVNDPRDVEMSEGTLPGPYMPGRSVSHINLFRALKEGTDSEALAFQDYGDLLWRMIVKGERHILRQNGKTYEYRLLLAKACIKCGERLTDPVSVETGIGPVCSGRRGRKKNEGIRDGAPDVPSGNAGAGARAGATQSQQPAPGTTAPAPAHKAPIGASGLRQW